MVLTTKARMSSKEKERRLEIASFLFLLLISNLQSLRDNLQSLRDSPESLRVNLQSLRDSPESLRVNLQSLRDSPESLRVNLQSLRDSPEGAWGRDSPKPLRLFCRW